MQMLDWIKEIISTSIWDAVAEVIESLLNFMFKYISQVVIDPTEPGKYLTNFDQYLRGVQFFAGGLLVIFVVLAVFRQLSGVMYQSEKSVGTYFLHITFAGALIYILPKTVTLVFLPINNALISFIGEVGIDTSRIEDSFQSAWGLIREENILKLIFLILIIALFALGIAAAIRYIETLLVILISPLVALSVINNSDGLNIWIRETVAIIFTQTIHFLILQILISIMAGVDNFMVMMILSIGAIAVGLKGPQILRQYLYKTGTSSVLVSSAGTAGRIGMIGMLVKR
jgi:hypothetical protein